MIRVPYLEALPAARYQQPRRGNEPKFEVREVLFRVLGVDLSQIHGFGAYTALKLIGECGRDMMLTNQRLLLGLLFQRASGTLLDVAPQRLGGQLGTTMILHSWDQLFKPHVHVAGSSTESASRTTEKILFVFALWKVLCLVETHQCLQNKSAILRVLAAFPT